MLQTIKKEMAISFLRHYVKLYMIKNGISSETEALAEITKNLPILAFGSDDTEKIGATFISKNKSLFTEETLYPTTNTEIIGFDSLFNVPPATIKGHATIETCTFVNIFHQSDMLYKLVNENEAGLDDNVFRLFPKKISWSNIKDKKFSSDFIEENVEKIDWSNICKTQTLEEELMHKFADKLDWGKVSRYQPCLSEDFMDYFQNKLNWTYLCEYQKMSETFMTEHSNHMIWRSASRFQPMSLEFIEKHKDDVDWNNISMYKHLTTDFIEKYYTVVHIESILAKQNLAEAFIRNHYHEWGNGLRCLVFSNQCLSKSFCDEHKKDIMSRSQYDGTTWYDLFFNDKLEHFDFKGTEVIKNVDITEVHDVIARHKGPIMVKPSHCKYYYRSVYVRNKNLYRVVMTESGYKNWTKCYTPLGSGSPFPDLFSIQEVINLMSINVIEPAPEKTDK